MEITSFDSLEEMQNALEASVAAANKKLFPAQIDLRDDVDNPRYWFMPTDYGFSVFGHAYSLQEDRAGELAAGASPDEADECVAAYSVNRVRGFVFGRAYSVCDPFTFETGELGSSHVSQLCPISESVFEMARLCGWNERDEKDVNSLFLRAAVVDAVREMIGK